MRSRKAFFKMVRSEQDELNNVFLQTLMQDDLVLLKTILQGVLRSRSSSHLKQLLQVKNELGGFTPLQYVCLQGNSNSASYLIDTGSADIDEKGQYGWTSLHAAAYSGDVRTVRILLNSCADCFAKDQSGNLPIDYANSSEIKELLRESMKRKNLKIFNELQIEYDLKDKSYRRSQSCFPNISLVKLNALKEKCALEEKDEVDESTFFTNVPALTLRKWRTCADLSRGLIDEDNSLNYNTF